MTYPDHSEKPLRCADYPAFAIAEAETSEATRPGRHRRFLSGRRWKALFASVVSDVESRLRNRSDFDPAIWGEDEGFRRFAQWFLARAADELGWPNARFAPADDAAIVLWEHQYGSSALEILLDIEDIHGVRIDDEEWIELHNSEIGPCIAEIYSAITARRQGH